MLKLVPTQGVRQALGQGGQTLNLVLEQRYQLLSSRIVPDPGDVFTGVPGNVSARSTVLS